jgi:hypothetical protein
VTNNWRRTSLAQVRHPKPGSGFGFENKMERTMKTLLLACVTTMVLAASAAPARAQVIDELDANIPFEFTVRNTTLPAGNYVIKRSGLPAGQVMEIRTADDRKAVFFMTISAQLPNEPRKSELLFDRVGDRYFLSKIFEVGSRLGVELPRSHQERRLEHEGAMVQVQTVDVTSETHGSR